MITAITRTAAGFDIARATGMVSSFPGVRHSALA